MRSKKYQTDCEQNALMLNNSGKNILSKSLHLDKRPSSSINNLNGSFCYKENLIETISDNIEEDVNNTRRLSCMIKMKNINMIPSRVMRYNKEESQNPIVTIANELRKFITEKDEVKKFNDIERIFSRVILLDEKFSHILKIIKNVYEERIKKLTNLFPQYNKRIYDLTFEVAQLKKLYEEVKVPTLYSTKINLNKTNYDTEEISISFPTSVKNTIDNISKKNKELYIPKLDLSKVEGNFPNEKIVYVPIKKTNINDNEGFGSNKYYKKRHKTLNASVFSHKGSVLI